MKDASPARLDTAGTTAAVAMDGTGQAVWRYLGPGLGDRPLDPPMPPVQATFALDTPAEIPLLPAGGGWFGPGAMDLRASDGQRLPLRLAVSSSSATRDHVQVEMVDARAEIACAVTLRACQGGAIRIETSVENRGPSPISVERFPGVVLPLPSASREILSWYGIHAAEFNESREPLPAHGWYREGRSGITGHGGPPGIYVMADGSTFDTGEVVAFQLAWSGDSRLAVERLDDGRFVATAEAVLQPGETVLDPGMRYSAPPVLLAISGKGRNGAMAQHHAALREIVRWPGGTMAPRPVHLNSWEACYFDHDEQRIGSLAESAAKLGVERFVLDDGWFKGRSDDRRALGDWTADPVKYPSGLSRLARKVEKLGLQFGLWVEPEMISPDSDLYRAHPEWILGSSGAQGPLGRHQLVLDMRKPAVRNYLLGRLDALLREAPIGYLKWDHNRALAPPGGAAQVAGTYELLARLRAAHPDVEIESCAAGGGRCDAGIASYVHRFWASDNLDAVSRVSIQRGFAAFLPPEMMGSHVGASPAHATGRRQSLAFRAAVACMGHFGLELDPARLSDDERTKLAEWIDFYKRWRSVIHGGELRLGSGPDGLLWQAHGDGGQWLLFVTRTAPSQNKRPQPLTLPFAAGRSWDVRCLRIAGVNRWLGHAPWPVGDDAAANPCAGDWLASAGLPLPQMAGQCVAVFHLATIPTGRDQDPGRRDMLFA